MSTKLGRAAPSRRRTALGKGASNVATFLLCVCLATALTAVVAYDPTASASDLESKLKLGEHWYGPKLSKEDLTGKVVRFIEAKTLA